MMHYLNMYSVFTFKIVGAFLCANFGATNWVIIASRLKSVEAVHLHFVQLRSFTSADH